MSPFGAHEKQRSVPAPHRLLQTPEIIVQTWRAARHRKNEKPGRGRADRQYTIGAMPSLTKVLLQLSVHL
jgi:hypothetical protein